MAEIKVFDGSGQAAGTLPVPDKLAKANAKMALVHQVVVAEQAGRRQGTVKTLRRDEVTGSNVKIRRQKGTGRSRQGDKRVPHFRGGGVVHGPKPRDYHQDTPRKMRQAAFRTGLNSRVQNDRVFVFDGVLTEAKTKVFAALLVTMGLNDRKLLILISEADNTIARAARNLPNVVLQTVGQTNLTDVLRSEVILCTRTAWDELSARVGGTGALANSTEDTAEVAA